jgi:hypothetical protein
MGVILVTPQLVYLPNLILIDSHGVFVGVEKGVLYSAPAYDTMPPEPDLDNLVEVTSVTGKSVADGRIFLRAVNRLFNTDFKVEEFAGR